MPVAFVKPNTKKTHYGSVAALSAIEPPVWLILMSQAVVDGVVIDMEAEDIGPGELVARLRELQAERVVILATGSHPSAHIQQGEAAAALKERITQEMGIPVEVHDHLPFDPTGPAGGTIDLARIPLKKYRAHNWHAWGRQDRLYGATFASISCPFTCDFCCVQDFYRSGYRQRRPAFVARDIRALFDAGVTNIKMMDELFAIDNAGIREVCDSLAASGMAPELNIWAYGRIDSVTPAFLKKIRAAGVRWLAYGIESGSEQIRAGVAKGKFTNGRIRDIVAMTKDAGIHVVGNFMFGFWDDDRSTMGQTLEFARELACEYVNFYCMSVYKGSKLYDDMKARGVDLPATGAEYAQMSPYFKPVPTAKLSGLEVLEFRDAAFKAYFTDTGYLAMMAGCFGAGVVEEIRAMAAINIRERT